MLRAAREADVPVLPVKLESSALREVALADRRDVLPWCVPVDAKLEDGGRLD
ncbi:hypothetical protein [Paraburkholderia haematera]|uniref:hypothetical protein n=1 Tax=Paraburkholderia haematera TaxID=2793077 RepID=UPI001B8C2B42|nr:hypothetical protein [Paraburkholderia haematera]